MWAFSDCSISFCFAVYATTTWLTDTTTAASDTNAVTIVARCLEVKRCSPAYRLMSSSSRARSIASRSSSLVGLMSGSPITMTARRSFPFRGVRWSSSAPAPVERLLLEVSQRLVDGGAMGLQRDHQLIGRAAPLLLSGSRLSENRLRLLE